MKALVAGIVLVAVAASFAGGHYSPWPGGDRDATAAKTEVSAASKEALKALAKKAKDLSLQVIDDLQEDGLHNLAEFNSAKEKLEGFLENLQELLPEEGGTPAPAPAAKPAPAATPAPAPAAKPAPAPTPAAKPAPEKEKSAPAAAPKT